MRRTPSGGSSGSSSSTRDRYARLLFRTDKKVSERAFEREKYRGVKRLDDQAILLIDDTWTPAPAGPDRVERIRKQLEHCLFPLRVRRAKYGLTKEMAIGINAFG